MLRRAFGALASMLRRAGEQSVVHYSIGSDGFVGTCVYCGWGVYEGSEWVEANRGELFIYHLRCYDEPITELGL